MRFIARRLRAVMLLALFLGSPLPFGTAGHRAFADDTACDDPDGGASGPPRIDVAGDATPLTHCAICHLARTASDPRVPRVAAAETSFCRADLPTPAAAALIDAVRGRTQPSRAPPPPA